MSGQFKQLQDALPTLDKILGIQYMAYSLINPQTLGLVFQNARAHFVAPAHGCMLTWFRIR